MSNRTAVIFDLDGTLTRPHLDFDAIRAEIGIERGPILEAIEGMSPQARRRAETILLRHEAEAAARAELQEDAAFVLEECRRRGHAVAILTRNARIFVDEILARFELRVDALRTRENGAVKPSPAPLLAICSELAADPQSSWMIGDYLFDVQSGRSAGCRTVLMIGDAEPPDYAPQADFVIRRLCELLPLVRAVAAPDSEAR
jgi:HAD superfamily hydrolase (TIGR01509 family)